jgi:hypothetical protein
MNGQKEQNFAACAHIHVERFRVENDGKVFEEQWRCRECGAKFVSLDSLFAGPQKIQIMEPMKTLRDEFAMAAMQADALQSAIIAAAYIAQGKRFDGDIPNLSTAVKEHYETADKMLEARK